MKRIVLITFAFVIALMPTPAFADIIWEPDNSFYNNHRSQCETLYNWRTYIAKGSANVYKAPNDGTVVATLEGGAEIPLNTIYTAGNGGVWAFSEGHNGWINLYEFLRKYDAELFEEEHADSITAAEVNLGERCGNESGIVLWAYPNSGEIREVMFDYESSTVVDEFSDIVINRAYTDEYGMEWGYIGYWRGNRNAWVCLSAPRSTEVKAAEEVGTAKADAPVAAPYAPVETGAPAYKPGGKKLSLPIAGVGLAAIAAGGAAVIIRTKGKKKD